MFNDDYPTAQDLWSNPSIDPPTPTPTQKKNTKGEGEGRGDTTKHVFLPLQEKQMIFMLEMLLFCQLVFTWFNTSIKK